MPAKTKIKTTKKPLTPEMARLVRRRREAAGMSQLELARRVGVARAQIKRIEAAELARIDEALARKLAEALLRPKKLAAALQALEKRTKPARARKKKVQGNDLRSVLVRVLEDAGLLDRTLRDLLG